LHHILHVALLVIVEELIDVGYLTLQHFTAFALLEFFLILRKQWPINVFGEVIEVDLHELLAKRSIRSVVLR